MSFPPPYKRQRVEPRPFGAAAFQHPTADDPSADIAFELQMQEAMSASAAASMSASTSDGRLELGDQFSLYFKGLVMEEPKLAAIGVAIFDSSNAVVFEASKPLGFPEAEMRDEVAELEAFVQGLEFALNLEIHNVMCACFDLNPYHYLYGGQKPKVAKVAELADRAILLQKCFVQCYLSTATTENNTELVLELARSSIAKQAGKPFNEVTLVTHKTCPICLEETAINKMYEVGGCEHSFCSSCIQQYVTFKVRDRRLPRCPQVECRSQLDINFCKTILPENLRSILEHLAHEASIPTTERMYCPNPRCSHLMSKTEAFVISASLPCTSGTEFVASTCMKCQELFCMSCMVLWHSDMSCDEYKKRLEPESNDAKFRSPATYMGWKECPSCHRMIERVSGCSHIKCRCGNHFCYSCGRGSCSCDEDEDDEEDEEDNEEDDEDEDNDEDEEDKHEEDSDDEYEDSEDEHNDDEDSDDENEDSEDEDNDDEDSDDEDEDEE